MNYTEVYQRLQLEYGNTVQPDQREVFQEAFKTIAELMNEKIADSEELLDLLTDYAALAKQTKSMHQRYEKADRMKRGTGEADYLCPRCGHRVRPFDRHCSKCGKRVEA